MQQVEVETIGLEATKAGLAGSLDPAAPGVLRIGLADQEDLVAKAGQRFTEQAFRRAVAVHFGGVDQGQAQFDACAKRRDFLFAQARVLAHAPRALPEGGHGRLIG